MALSNLHENGFVHRDIKPENVGVIDGKQAVLLDMGGVIECGLEEDIKPTPGRTGTIGYLAPEMERAWYNHKVDMWSLGVVLFQIVEGYHPWPCSKNPWRAGHEPLQPAFLDLYGKQMQRLRRESREDSKQGK